MTPIAQLPLEPASDADQQASAILELAVQGAADGFWYWNLHSHQGWFSDRWFDLMGYSRSQMRPSWSLWAELTHPDDREHVARRIEAHLIQRQAYDVEFRCLTGAGQYRWFRSCGQAQWDDAGHPVRMAGSITDITDQKEQQSRYGLDRERLHLALGAAGLHDWELDLQTGQLQWGHDPAAVFGDDAVPENAAALHALVADADLPAFEQAWQAMRDGGQPLVLEFRLAGLGLARWLLIQGRRLQPSWDRPARGFGFVQEITARKQSDSEVLESERRFRMLWNTTNDAIVLVGEDNCIQYANPAVLAVFGYSPEELQGQSMAKLQPADLVAGHQTGMQRYVNTNVRRIDWRNYETRARHRDGHEFPVEISFSEVAAAQGRRFVAFIRDITRRRQAEERVQYLALHDPLTSLPNRLYLENETNRRMAAVTRANEFLAVLFIDLDRFKQVNDSLGYASGDELLVQVARRLQLAVRGSDTVARQGGDEFLVLVEALDTVDTAGQIAGKLLAALEVPFRVHSSEVHVSASIGIALFPGDGVTAQMLLVNADTAMFHAKENGRNRYQFFDGQMNVAAQRRLLIEQQLRFAMEREQLSVHFQPVLDLTSGRIVSAEALLRWCHPTLGMVDPAEFIASAETSGMINRIGEWVLRQACAQAVRWQLTAAAPLCIAVNVSARQIFQANLVQTVRDCLDDCGLAPQLLILELTESTLVRNPEEAGLVLQELATLGVRLSIDDFGTGYSSLGYLKRYPFSELKIDRTFVRDVLENSNDAAIIGAVLAMSRSLNLTVVAEGVETEGQLQFLRERHCDKAQGYLLGEPMPIEQFEKLLSARQ
jgi:diguanylate cyclase (GGDEF)-like protein/PAS domain S-box-containing protein